MEELLKALIKGVEEKTGEKIISVHGHKTETNIKSAETIIKESHFLADRMVIFSKQQVIDLMKASQRQAIQATLEHVQWLDNSFLLGNENKLIDIVSIINAPELKVI